LTVHDGQSRHIISAIANTILARSHDVKNGVSETRGGFHCEVKSFPRSEEGREILVCVNVFKGKVPL
jgi:hypothetical protein